MKKLAHRIALFCVAIGSGFYLTQIIPVSPIYPMFVIAIVICAMTFMLNGGKLSDAPVNKINWILLVASIHFFGYLVWISPLNSALGFYLNFVCAAVVWRMLQYADYEGIQAISDKLVNFSIILGSVEAFVRWFLPFQDFRDEFVDYVNESGSTFYLYKFNSIMYQDSNYVAVWLLVVLAFYLECPAKKKKAIKIILLSALLLLTICRAVIMVYVVYVIYKYAHKKIKSQKIVTIFTVALSMLAVTTLVHFAANDDSFKSKLTIYTLVTSLNIANFSIEQLLFGDGLSNSAKLLDGIAAHNIIVEVFMDTGLIGTLYSAFALLHFANFSGRAGKAILVLYVVAGMSFAPVNIPYMFVALSILAFVVKHEGTVRQLNAASCS